jgi:hypothetical protein
MPILIMASELHKDIRKVYVSQISTSTTAPTTLTVTTVSTNNLLTVNSTISNLNLSTSTISNINATNITSTNFIGSNATLTNSVFTTLTSGTINFTTAIGSTGITIPSLLATTSISSASIQGTNITITNSNFTNLTSSTINFTNAIGTTSTIGTIRSTNVISTNLSSSTINATGSTVGTFNVTGTSTLQNTTVTNQTLSTLNATTGITTGTLLATSIQATNIVSSNTSSGILRFTTAVGSIGLTTGTILATTSISTGQMTSTNLSTSTINATGGTIGTLNITGTSTLQNTTATNQTLATLNATTGITTATLLATTSISTGQFTSNNISSGTINVATGITTSTLLATGSISTGQLASANISTTNLYVTTLITGSNLGINNLTTGTLRVNSTRGILIGSSTDIDTGRLISAHNNTLGSGGQTYITLGVGASSNNQSEFSFAYFTSGSTLNRTSIGLFGSPNTLSILGTGNVGVGNTNPSYKFDVTGDMRATGNIYLGSGYIYPNTNITTASNLFLNVYSGTLSINGPTTLLGYGINAAGTSTIGNIISIGNGNVGIGVAAPNSILQVGASVDTIYGNNPLASNRINIFGPARASPTYAGTSDINGTLFINSTSTYGRNVGASIALGGRSNNFGGGNLHMAFARINGVQATNTDTYDGNFVIETQAAGSMYERLRIMQDGNIGIGTTNPLYLLDVNGTVDAVTYTGGSVSVSGSVVAANNIAATGNLTNGGYDFILGNANQVARGNSGASRALVKDGAASLKINYAGDFTGGVEVQGSSLSHSGFFSASGNSNTLGNLVTTGGNVGIGTRTPTQIMHIQRSGSDNYLKIDAGGGASNLSGIMLSEHNINFGWSLRHDAGTDLLYISYQDNTPSFTNTTIFNRSGQIGINKTPGYTLDINGNRLNMHNAAGTGGGQNLFEGLENTNIRAQIVLSSMYSDLVIASSQANDNHGSTLTFASYNPSNKADYRKWVINQGGWGARVHMLEFGYNPNNIPNPHDAANDTYTVMTLDGVNDRVGISNRSPGFKLDVNGDFRAYGGRYIIQNTQDGGTGRGIYMWQESDQNWAIYMGQSGAGRSFSGGTATTGVYGFSAHAVRFRAFNNSSSPANGWIFENNQEGHAASIRSDGHMYIAGNLGIGTVSPSYKLHVSGDTLTNGWFRTTGDAGLWSDTYGRGMRAAILGDYGNIETHGTGKNEWEGYSIHGRYVFMSSDNDNCGIYNDVDNHWITYWDRPSATYRICHDTAKNTSIGSGGGWVQVCSGGGQFYVGGNRSGPFMRLNDDMWLSDPQNGSINVRNGDDSNWGTFVGYFNNQCTRESKKNIIKFEEDDLNNLYNDTLTTDVYEFHYKEDQDTDKKKIGIILEESPDYMCVTPDGKSLYNLSYITMLHGAIKVLDKKVKDLESENTTLKSQIQQIFTHLGL